MLGRFLEISVQTDTILESVQFWESLGFVQVTTGDIWPHRYGVLTDGRLFLGLHEYRFDSPALTWVREDVAASRDQLEGRGVRLAFCKLKEDEFHELGFADPDDQMVAVLEARTFSPPPPDSVAESRLGWFLEYSLPVRDVAESARFWEPLGFVAMPHSEKPYPRATLCNDALNIGLHETRSLKEPVLSFRSSDMAERVAWLRERGFDLEPAGTAETLRSPEGLTVHLLGARR